VPDDTVAAGGVIGPTSIVAPAQPAFIDVQVAPYRRGFLVDGGDIEQLRSALLGAATIWGGMRSPILPVEPDGTVAPAWLEIASTIDPAVLVDFTTQARDNASAWTGAQESPWPVVDARPLEDAGFWGIHPIAVFTPEELSNQTLFLPKGRTLFDLVSVGRVDLPDEMAWWREVAHGVLETDNPVQLAKAQLGGHTVLEATAFHDDDTLRIEPMMETVALLWLIADTNDPREVITWWNIRALRFRGWRKNISILATPDAISDDNFARELRSLVSHHVVSTPDLVVASLGLPAKQLREAAEQLGFEPHEGTQFSERHFTGQPDPERRLTYAVNVDLRQFWIGERVSGVSRTAEVSLQRPNTRFREPSPLRWNPALVGARPVAIRLSGEAITGPQRPPVARCYHQHARWHHGRLEFLSSALPTYDFELHIPEAYEILQAACSDRQVTYQLSDKARHVRGVWALAKQPSLFRRIAIINAIRVLTPESSRELVRTLNERTDLTESEKHELRTLAAANRVTMRTLLDISSHAMCGSQPQSAIAAALQDLVTSGMVLRGLRADCPVCSVQHLYTLDEAQPVPRCLGCGANANYAVDSVGEPALYYRINTLVQILSLNGGLAPLAATSLLVEEGAHIVPGAELRSQGRPAGEVDLLGWRGVILFAGEAKMSANQLANSDHERDISKTALLGAQEHIAVCLETVPEETRISLQAACDRVGITLRILDASNLLIDTARQETSPPH
jgi:hypothetical protein